MSFSGRPHFGLSTLLAVVMLTMSTARVFALTDYSGNKYIPPFFNNSVAPYTTLEQAYSDERLHRFALARHGRVAKRATVPWAFVSRRELHPGDAFIVCVKQLSAEPIDVRATLAKAGEALVPFRSADVPPNSKLSGFTVPSDTKSRSVQVTIVANAMVLRTTIPIQADSAGTRRQ